MNKGNILYIGGFELPDKNAAAQRVVANSKILKSLGYEVLLIGVDKKLKSDSLFLQTKKEYEGLNYFSLKYPCSLIDWFKYLFSIKFIKELESLKPKVIIAYNYPGFAFWRLLKYCNKNNIKLIGDCTEWYEPKGNFIFNIIKSADVYVRMKLVHPKINGMIVISNYLFNYYKNFSNKIINIPPLVDLKMDKWNTEDKQNLNEFTFVYAGSPGSGTKDRIDKIIDVLAEIKKKSSINFKLNIIGLTKDQYVNTFGLEKLPKNFNDFLFFKGRLPHVETLTEVSSSDFVIFIRDKNLTNTAGFPTKFVESISCGTPVLSNSSSNIEEYLIENKTGFLLETESYDELNEKLSEILKLDKKDILQMKKFCKNSELFDILNYTSKFEVFINDVLND